MDKVLFLHSLKELDIRNKDIITLYNEISALAMKYAGEIDETKNKKCAYYLSMEFLIGRSFYNNLLELGVLEETREILAGKGIDINIFGRNRGCRARKRGTGKIGGMFSRFRRRIRFSLARLWNKV